MTLQRSRHRILALIAGALMIAHAGGAAAQIETEADYRAAFDRETAGAFSRLGHDPDAALAAYPAIVAAYAKIEDALFEAYSPHANTLPAWYADQLLKTALGNLPDTPQVEALLVSELESGEFDRVVHAYFLIARSRLSLLQGGAPTVLWRRMLEVARGDADNRFWISLALAESAMLPAGLYERMHTRIVAGPETVRERIGKNADWLGPRLPRVLGIEPPDLHVRHQRMRDAENAARRRVRAHQIVSLGRDAAYRSAREDLDELESGEFDSKQFHGLMQHDLPLMLDRFGLPDDPDALLESIRFLCRGRGANRMVLWTAADALAERYQLAMAARPPAPEERPLPGPDEIVAMGEAAQDYLIGILEDRSDPAGARRLLETDAIERVARETPADDVAPLRAALRDAFHALGYPPDLHPAYQRAFAALGNEESSHDAASRQTLDQLTRAFRAAQDADAFDAAFDPYRVASRDGRIPARDADPGFVRAFIDAAARVLSAEAGRERAAAEAVAAAQRARRDAAAQIEAAEQAAIDANRNIVAANARLAAEEARQQAAVAAYNAAIGELNDIIESANAAGRGPAGDAARAEARRQEGLRNATIAASEKEANAASQAILEAEGRAEAELERARRERGRAGQQAALENQAVESERAAGTERQRARLRFDEVLGRVIVGLEFVGVRADPSSIGDDSRDPGERVAAIAATLASAERAASARRADLEHAKSARDEAVRAFAGLALEPPSAPGPNRSPETP